MARTEEKNNKTTLGEDVLNLLKQKQINSQGEKVREYEIAFRENHNTEHKREILAGINAIEGVILDIEVLLLEIGVEDALTLRQKAKRLHEDGWRMAGVSTSGVRFGYPNGSGPDAGIISLRREGEKQPVVWAINGVSREKAWAESKTYLGLDEMSPGEAGLVMAYLCQLTE